MGGLFFQHRDLDNRQEFWCYFCFIEKVTDYLLQKICRIGAYMKIFNKVSILVVELLSSQGNNLVDLGNNETSESVPSRISQVEDRTGTVLDVSGIMALCALIMISTPCISCQP